MVNPNQYTGLMSRHNLYTIDVDRERNCYNCRGFGHIARNCSTWCDGRGLQQNMTFGKMKRI